MDQFTMHSTTIPMTRIIYSGDLQRLLYLNLAAIFSLKILPLFSFGAFHFHPILLILDFGDSSRTLYCGLLDY